MSEEKKFTRRSQFERGHRKSKGRPSGARGEKTIVREMVAEIHEVGIGGQKRKLNTFELLLISMRDAERSGDLKAAKWLDAYRTTHNVGGDGGACMVVPETADNLEMFAKEIEIRNRYAVNPELRDNPETAYLLENYHPERRDK